MHPNCRHEFIPFVEDMNTKEELEKIIKDSNHFEELSKDDKLFKIYNRNQALNRQWVDESREYHSLKDKLGDKFPYKTLGRFKRARRSGTLEYKQLHYQYRDSKLYNEWKSIVGEKNMPKTLEMFQKLRYNKDNEYRALQFEVQKGRIVKKIGTDELPLTVRVQKQCNHIKGTKGYSDGKSFLNVSSQQEGIDLTNRLVKEYAGKGELQFDKNGKWKNTETIHTNEVIGFLIDKNDGHLKEAKDFKIHYSINGTHIVPMIDRSNNNE